MKLAWLARLARRHIVSSVARRPPDVIIGTSDSPYLLRWHVIPRNRYANLYLHRFMHSDDDRALHDHPWISVSFIVEGSYTEHSICAGGVRKAAVRTAGALKARRAKSAHRVELHDGPCWTLFFTGPRIRQWGFHCPHGWRHWKAYVAIQDGVSTIGRGCD
jgi:hypothetical protein